MIYTQSNSLSITDYTQKSANFATLQQLQSSCFLERSLISAKKPDSIAAHSSSITPPTTSVLWFNTPEFAIISVSDLPFASYAPKYTFLIRAFNIAPIHIGHGSKVT